ncbi:MAG: trypsin-like peptidase domain-containing protein [Myxococcales bacterium]|nr:trypsin-like peptidase domain-containing protein [Myxococcales bacterium]
MIRTSPKLVPVLLALALPTFAQGPKDLALPSLAPLVDSVKGAVVNVEVQKRMSDEQRDMLERFSVGRRGREEPLNPGSGSGFVIDPKGLVLTNNHVVEGAVVIRVRFDDGRVLDGEVLGRDPLTDVAVVKLKGKFSTLPSVPLGDSGSIRPGDWVVAIGNPFGLASSVSAGIISALDRQLGASRYDQFLQTDAAINPGNSGGPLFNLKGQVVGMNTAIIGGGTGIGFAVPSNLIKAVLPQLQDKGYVTRGWLGVSIQDVTPALAKALGVPTGDGALVSQVNEGSPAAKGGVKDEDVVVAIDGEKVGSSTALTRVVALKPPDSTVTLTLYRVGKEQTLKVKLGTRPDLEEVGAVDKPEVNERETSRQKIGLAFQDIDPRLAQTSGLPRAGALVVDVTPGSPAEKAGLRRGVVVVEANRKPIAGRDDLMKALKDARSGSVILLRVTAPGAAARSLLAIEVP